MNHPKSMFQLSGVHCRYFRIGISHIKPLIMKPNKVGISPYNAYAYVLLGFLIGIGDPARYGIRRVCAAAPGKGGRP